MLMKTFPNFVIRSFIVAACLVMTFAFQVHYLSAFDIDQRISLFYIPAAVITLSALTMRYGASLGIFLGYSAVNLYGGSVNIENALLLSATPALVSMTTIAVLSLVSKRIGSFFKPNSTLIEVDAFDILFFCAGYGLINASLHHLLFYFDTSFGTPISPLSVTQMMFGDLTGSFLGFIALNLAYSTAMRFARAGRRSI